MQRKPREFTGPIMSAINATSAQCTPRVFQPGVLGYSSKGAPELVEVKATPDNAPRLLSKPMSVTTKEGFDDPREATAFQCVYSLSLEPHPEWQKRYTLSYLYRHAELCNGASPKPETPVCRAPLDDPYNAWVKWNANDSSPEQGFDEGSADKTVVTQYAFDKRAIRELYAVPNWVKYFDSNWAPHLRGLGLTDLGLCSDAQISSYSPGKLAEIINTAESRLLNRLCIILLNKSRPISYPNIMDDEIGNILIRHVLNTRGN